MKKASKSWMVWDTDEHAVAVVDGMPAIQLSAETAKQFTDLLNKQELNSSQREQRPQ